MPSSPPERPSPPERQRVTIYDVAARAGVAISTVSRVLNGSDDVSDATRERVQHVIHELRFRPDRTAKTLAQRPAPTVVVAVPTFTTPFHNELLKGVRNCLRDRTVDLLLCDLSWKNPVQSLLSFLKRGTVDGLILAGLPVDEELARELQSLSAPVVLIGEQWAAFDSFYWDEITGARLATEHLIACGHVRIGMITTHRDGPVQEARERGYCEALSAADVPCDASLIRSGTTDKHAGFSEESGYEAMQELLTLDGPPVTAVFASSDVQAVGAWKAARDQGLHVPEDVAIIGYDDIKTSQFIGLTSVAQHMLDVGERATTLLLRRIDGHRDDLVAELIEPILVTRDTTC